jgi:hypothetical protein
LEIPRKKVEVVGSRYLSNTFLHGYFNTKDGSRIYSSNYFYDYDKINGMILLCTDSRTVFGISEDQVRSVTLVNNNDELFSLEKVPSIDKYHFVEVLASGAKYNLYKQIKTKLSASDYENVSLGQVAGHEYDEYEDEVNYFALNVVTNQLQKFSMKRSSIKKAFAKDGQKVNDFMQKNTDSGDEEEYVISLVNYLND